MARSKAATDYPAAESFLPARRTLRTLAAAAAKCEGCPLYVNATQTVFGEGPSDAAIVMVGEQPGDAEDTAGQPFVGPAGRLLNGVLEEVGIDRSQVYVTNAVKHFKWTPRGKRRMHARPGAREVAACHPWLEAELELLKPDVLVCLGATAAQSLLGRSFRLTQHRGEFIESAWAKWTLATLHPSAVLRAKQTDQADEVLADFTADLRRVAAKLRAT
jgi:DNA polymerase